MILLGSAVWICCALFGCQSPFEPIEADELLKQSIDTAINRELKLLPPDQRRLMTQPPAVVEEALAERRDELDAIGPDTGREGIDYPLGLNLSGGEQVKVELTLLEAIHSAVENNLTLQASRLQPAISAQDIINAESVFDALLFSNVELAKVDQPSAVPVIMGNPIGTGNTANERYRFETGIRKLTTYGTTLSISTLLTRNQNNSSEIDFSPDPAYRSTVLFGLTQPLLRGFGSEVNTATIRLSENVERRAFERFRADLLQIVSRTEQAYWLLVFTWHNLVIQQWLVEVGEEVRDVLDRRREFDTKPAQYADAVAKVEQRKGNVIIARRQVRAASDALKVLINDWELTIGSEIIIRPVDPVVEAPLEYSLRETIMTAIANRPELQEAMLSISDAQIRQHLADNLRLPQLNLSGQIAYYGLDDAAGSSYANLSDGDYIDYVLGVSFEYPFGNRGAEAAFQKARLDRTASLINYWRTVQDIVLDVKDALRNVIANYELIQARRSFRVAQAENLRTLLVEEETLAGLTPEFLNLKFQRQEGLAVARQQEIQAIVNYDQSLAELYRAMGTGLKMKQIEFDLVDPMTDPDALHPR